MPRDWTAVSPTWLQGHGNPLTSTQTET